MRAVTEPHGTVRNNGTVRINGTVKCPRNTSRKDRYQVRCQTYHSAGKIYHKLNRVGGGALKNRREGTTETAKVMWRT